MSMPSCQIIADSISPEGVRLTTMEVKIHRFVLAEFNTHRVFSRNSASSRAIPLAKQLDRALHDPALPVSMPSEQKGMQGGEDLSLAVVDQAYCDWQDALSDARRWAARLGVAGVHKSVANRLLEPFMWHTVVVTATAWENFFALRTDKDAQPEIRVAAAAMQAAYRDCEDRVKTLRPSEWHLPYISSEDYEAATDLTPLGESMYPLLAKVSAARCARVSYLTQDGRRDLSEDLRLYDRLVTDRLDRGLAIHWSPLEHVATPWPSNRQPHTNDLCFNPLLSSEQRQNVATQHLPRVGNLLGWRSLRTEVEAINKERTYR